MTIMTMALKPVGRLETGGRFNTGCVMYRAGCVVCGFIVIMPDWAAEKRNYEVACGCPDTSAENVAGVKVRQ